MTTCFRPRIRTVHTDPDHHTIGKRFKAWDGHVYLCDSHEDNHGYWMTRVDDPTVRKNVSERAIGRTFHKEPAWRQP